ncbi:hypothetical protein [Actinomadura bangladeshensis]|uniref:Uncharacterized protein n=1 Tax=Actinomadura bangladeshensis TaxID=453573 RepID=A0A6L9Q8C4_9ACTN|nr:hypothetical protein [Actinomadura bangladeshensis]NEA21750.1 hypothetical protein [Actinomadura bangladeshensis]
MSKDSTDSSGGVWKAWGLDEGLELAKARLNGIRADEESVKCELSEAQAELHRAKAQLTALLGFAYMERIDRGVAPSDIAHRGLISIDELWLLLSGTYEPGEGDWIKRVATGLIAVGRNWRIDRLRYCLEELGVAATRFDNASRRWETLRHRVSDAEEDVRRITADLAAAAVSRKKVRPRSSSSGSGHKRAVIIPDVQGYECKPDPLLAATEVEFIQSLRRYREWAGNPSYRDMAERVTDGPSYGTLANVLRHEYMPRKLKTLEAFVRGLGGGDEDVRAWATAWRRLVASAKENV